MDSRPIPYLALHGSSCLSCFSSPPPSSSAPLKRCSSCRLARYCTPACAHQDWKEHRSFCRAVHALRSLPSLPPFAPLGLTATPDDLQKRRQAHRTRWAAEDDAMCAALRRELSPAEARMVYGAKRCGCDALRLANEIDALVLAQHLSSAASSAPSSTPPAPKPPQSVFVPSRVLSAPTPLPASWTAYLSSLPSPVFPSPPSPAELFHTHLMPLSPALTVLSALRALFPGADQAENLTLLLLDQTPETTKAAVVALEELFHQLPALKQLRTATVAPQDAQVVAVPPTASNEAKQKAAQEKVAHLPLCKICAGAGRQRTLEHFRSVSDFAAAPSPFSSFFPAGPSLTLAVSLNSSLAIALPPSAAVASDIDTSPTDSFWSASVFVPLADLAASPSPVGILIAAQTAEDTLHCLSIARASLPRVQTQGAFGPRRNVWREGRPRAEGWPDHRGGEERDGDGAVQWMSGWVGGFRLGVEAEQTGERGRENVGR
ncbi:hypothetical protein JCM10207_007082 [Rhodosporidiobolus poonsookiae]